MQHRQGVVPDRQQVLLLHRVRRHVDHEMQGQGERGTVHGDGEEGLLDLLRRIDSLGSRPHIDGRLREEIVVRIS